MAVSVLRLQEGRGVSPGTSGIHDTLSHTSQLTLIHRQRETGDGSEFTSNLNFLSWPARDLGS